MARREAFENARVTVVQVAAGEAHTLALTATGGVYSWGRGLFGRSGVGVFQDEIIPTQVVVETDDDDEHGSMGSSHSSSTATAQYHHNGSKVTQVAAGAYHNLALTADGAVWSWGDNAYMDGQLGRDKKTSQISPVSFTYRTPAEEVRRGAALWLQAGAKDERQQPKIILVEAGGMISSAVDVDGALWLWGAVPNPSEYFDTISSHTRNHLIVNVDRPERVRGLLGLRVYLVACGNEHIVALVEGRDRDYADCYAWGNNQFGQLGLGDIRARPYPQVVKALAASSVGSIVDLACGAFHTAILAVKEVNHPSKPQDNDTISKSATRGLLASNRSLTQTDNWRSEVATWCWTFGQGENGQLGHGTTSSCAHPALVEGLPKEEALSQVACGQIHTAVVTEAGVVWVWGMEGSRNMPARTFGESAASSRPMTGAKGIACGAAHTVTTANGGKDLWAWGRGKSGVLGLGHTSNSWLPCPVLWPPVPFAPWSADLRRSTPSQSEALYGPINDSPKDDVVVETNCPAALENKLSNPREDVEAIKRELAGVRRYAESLHAAVYGEVEVFSQLQPDDLANDSKQDVSGALEKKKALQEWERRVEAASDADLTRLDHFYRSMRARLKEAVFQRKMDEWCRRCRSAINHSSSSTASMEPPPQRHEHSTASTPSMDGLGDCKSGDSRAGEILQQLHSALT